MRNRFMTKEFWSEKDKRKHAIYSYMIGAVSTLVAYFVTTLLSSGVCAFQLAFAAVFGVAMFSVSGWLVEVWDGTGRGAKDIHDIDADMIGGFVGVLSAVIAIVLYI